MHEEFGHGTSFGIKALVYIEQFDPNDQVEHMQLHLQSLSTADSLAQEARDPTFPPNFSPVGRR